jgi:hypothetical protein
MIREGMIPSSLDSNGLSPLQLAAQMGQLACMQTLILSTVSASSHIGVGLDSVEVQKNRYVTHSICQVFHIFTYVYLCIYMHTNTCMCSVCVQYVYIYVHNTP